MSVELGVLQSYSVIKNCCMSISQGKADGWLNQKKPSHRQFHCLFQHTNTTVKCEGKHSVISFHPFPHSALFPFPFAPSFQTIKQTLLSLFASSPLSHLYLDCASPYTTRTTLLLEYISTFVSSQLHPGISKTSFAETSVISICCSNTEQCCRVDSQYASSTVLSLI